MYIGRHKKGILYVGRSNVGESIIISKESLVIDFTICGWKRNVNIDLYNEFNSITEGWSI